MKSIAIALKDRKELSLSIALSLVVFFLPMFVHQQFITGPVINAVLLLSFLYLGKSTAFFLALIPSTMALARGLLPLPLAPMVPFIMLSNCLYIEAFSRFYKKDSWTQSAFALIIASLLKMAFLFFIVKTLMIGMLNQALLPAVTMMMTWPQLWTALVGGAMALVIKKKYD